MSSPASKKRFTRVLRPSACRHPVLSLHPYWAKKPWNIVSHSIHAFSRPSQIVFDPFCGSGTTIFESLRLGRKAIGFDINPLAVFITETLTQPLNPKRILKLRHHLQEACESAKTRIFERGLFATRCPRCGASASVQSTVYDSINDAHDPRERSYEERYSIIQCNSEKSHKQKSILNKPHEEALDHPVEPLLRKPLLENSRINIYGGLSVADLFTPRNLAILHILLDKIKKTTHSDTIDFAKLAFSSILDDASMRRCEGGGLTLNSLWIPKKGMVERNPVDLFNKKINRVMTACRLLSTSLRDRTRGNSVEDVLYGDDSVFIKQITATEICDVIPSRSVDYIHTDPPFVDQVPYLELSSFWCHWLGIEIDVSAWENEIVLSDSSERPSKKRSTHIGQRDYESKLRTAISNMAICLKNDAKATFWFSAQKEQHWRVLTDSLKVHGFREESYWQVPRRIKTFKANRERNVAHAGKMLNHDILIHVTFDGRIRTPSEVSKDKARSILERAKRKLRQKRMFNAGDLYAEYLVESLEELHEPPPESFMKDAQIF